MNRMLRWICFCAIFICIYSSYESIEYWNVNNSKGLMKWQNLKFRRLVLAPTVTRVREDQALSSCYEVECQGNQCPKAGTPEAKYSFCYPSVIVTGIAKCGTSAMYSLLSKLPNTMLMNEKENCPFTRRRSHWKFFNSLPRYDSVTADTIIVDGCIHLLNNMVMVSTLRHPTTLYVLMTRDYAEMLWSSYNFWCRAKHDGFATCDKSRWINPTKHIRSPELFHEVVSFSHNGTKLPYETPLYTPNPCAKADSYYSEKLVDTLWATVPRYRTLVVASEELERHPAAVYSKLATRLNVTTLTSTGAGAAALEGQETMSTMPMTMAAIQKHLGNFSKVRINANEGVLGQRLGSGNRNDTAVGGFKKGKSAYAATPGFVDADKYTPGLYAASRYRPMLSASKALLDQCWQRDCLLTSQVTGYLYPSCLPQALALLRSGQWRSMNEIYQTHWARYGHTETEGEDATTTPAGINSVIVGSGDIRDGNDDTIGGSDSTSGHRNGDNSVGGRLATWPLDPLPFTGILVENRPMKLY